jgi:hypothetical protein
VGSISLQIPQSGQAFSTEGPKVSNSLTTLNTWANGNIDGANVAAALTGRRLIGEAVALVPGSTAVGNYFIAVDGSLVLSGASSTKAIKWWFADPANYAVVGKTNTLIALRYSLATNNTAPGASVTVSGQANVVTFAGASGNIVPSIGGAQAGGVSFSNPAANSALVSDGGTSAFPSAGALAPIIAITGATTAAASVMSVTVQMFVANS